MPANLYRVVWNYTCNKEAENVRSLNFIKADKIEKREQLIRAANLKWNLLRKDCLKIVQR